MKFLRRYWKRVAFVCVLLLPLLFYGAVALTARAAYDRHESARIWLQHVLAQPGGPRGGEGSGNLTLYRVDGLVGMHGDSVSDVFVTWPPEKYTFDQPDRAVFVMRPNAWAYWDVWYVEADEVPWLRFSQIALDDQTGTLRPSSETWTEPPWRAGFTAEMAGR